MGRKSKLIATEQTGGRERQGAEELGEDEGLFKKGKNTSEKFQHIFLFQVKCTQIKTPIKKP